MRAVLCCGLLAMCAGQAGADVKPDAGACVETYHIERARSPMKEPQKKIAAVTIDPAKHKPLDAYKIDGKPALFQTAGGAEIVVDARLFTDLTVADPTRMAAGQSVVVGRARTKVAGRELVRFLLEAEIVRSYWHIEATVCVERERAPGGGYEADLSGVHRYYTNKANERSFAYTLRVSPEGEIAIAGR